MSKRPVRWPKTKILPVRVWWLPFVALWLTACSPSSSTVVSQEAYVFGTRVELQAAGVTETQAQAALGAVLREFDRLHRTYHAWQPSELTALNEAIATGKPHRVSSELAGLIKRAQTLAAEGDGLFDPGIGGLIALWGFHDETFRSALPDVDALARLVAARPSIANLSIDADHTVTSSNRAVALDFGGYLKGVALDRAAVLLAEHGIHDALINIGGNVMALGKKGDRAWRIGIQHPRAAQAGGVPLATLELRDGEAIGTSGDYQRYFELNGQRYSHLIDPRHGAPAAGTQAVTVLIPPGTETGMRSDVLSKPLFVAGDDWLALANRLSVRQAMRIDADGHITLTAALKARLQFTAPDTAPTVVP